ncbi:hypothetical protein [Thermodesulfovibrio sp.]|uniref:hypothetical protein n=1 Tax=Thermodesulfovibrio sp. TaxID=2067987 RepID=UPI003096F16D
MKNQGHLKKFILKFSMMIVLIFEFLFSSSAYSKDIDFGMHLENDELKEFYLSISDYYNVPVRDVYVVRDRYPFIKDEELPILFFIVKEAKLQPHIILHYRKMGLSWYDIMVRVRLKPEQCFERYIVIEGPPYGKAWGHYKKHQKRFIVFRDVDIVELSNIHFISNYYHERPDIIVAAKKRYPKYIDVNREFYRKHKTKGRGL